MVELPAASHAAGRFWDRQCAHWCREHQHGCSERKRSGGEICKGQRFSSLLPSTTRKHQGSTFTWSFLLLKRQQRGGSQGGTLPTFSNTVSLLQVSAYTRKTHFVSLKGNTGAPCRVRGRARAELAVPMWQRSQPRRSAPAASHCPGAGGAAGGTRTTRPALCTFPVCLAEPSRAEPYGRQQSGLLSAPFPLQPAHGLQHLSR